MNPFEIFKNWYALEKNKTSVRIPSACCFTTIGLDGYPNSRFVSLKEIKNETFVVTGPLNSRKGKEVASVPKVSLTFWWANTEKQVRIQGNAFPISPTDAEKYFTNRHKDSKIVSTIFKQGETIESYELLQEIFTDKKKELETKELEKPKQWSGFYIEPVRIEFMEFESSRLHKRTLFDKSDSTWKTTFLQP